jgi:1,4-dihydroxy-2-naphthoyl-CoA hydrolase
MTQLPDGIDLVAAFNAKRGGFEKTMQLTFTKIASDEIRGEVPIGPHLTQPYGLVHGGVYASIVETLASVGAALIAIPRGQTTVGLENTTSFVRGVREGTLVGVAKPVHRGRTTQVWEVEVSEGGKLCATGRVRMLCMEAGAKIAGETVAVKG